jgi:hypothetical protein
MALTLTVGLATDDDGPLPPTLRPNVHHPSGGSVTDLGQLYALPNFAFIRDGSTQFLDADTIYATLASFATAMNNGGYSQDLSITSAGAVLLTCDAKTNVSLMSANDQRYPPNDPILHKQFWHDYAVLVKTKCDATGVPYDRIRFGWRNEVNNGPGATDGGWSGTLVDVVRLYAHFAFAIKSVSTQFRVGGLEWSNPGSTQSVIYGAYDGHRAGEGVIYQWMRMCADPPKDLYNGARIPIDFVSYHYFIDIPWVQTQFLVSEWINASGYDSSKVEQLLSESNWGDGAPVTGALEPRRAGEFGVAHICQRNQTLESIGIDYTSYTLLRRGTLTAPNGYDGDIGLYVTATGGAFIPSTIKQYMTAASMLGRRKIEFDLSDDAYNSGILVTATAQGSTRWILISRYCTRNSTYPGGSTVHGDQYEQFVWELKRKGYRPTPWAGNKDDGSAFRWATGMTLSEIKSYASGSGSIPAGIDPQVAIDLAEIQTRVLAFRASMDSDVTLQYTVEDPVSVTTVTEYTINNGTTNNPYRAWLAEYAIASNFTNAVNAALAQGTNTLTATFTGTASDLPRSLTVQPYQLTVVKIESNGASNNLGAYTNKPLARVSYKFLGLGTPDLIINGSDLEWDISEDKVWKATLTSAKRLTLPDGMTPGATCVLEVTQGGGGSLTYESGIIFPGGVTPIIPSTAGLVTYFTGAVSAGGDKLRLSARGPFPA